jgi:hypothetical protein
MGELGPSKFIVFTIGIDETFILCVGPQNRELIPRPALFALLEAIG